MSKRKSLKNASKKSNSRAYANRKRGEPSLGGAGAIRIIGGDFRGRKFPVLSAEGLRPSSDRVRETLFNWLQFEIPGALCLDAFAGSGALGLEALSRGAKSVTFVELNSKGVEQLRQNLRQLKVEKAQVIVGDALRQLPQLTQKFDGIFLDPPFNKGLMQPALALIFQYQLIDPNGWLYLEQEKALPWPELPQGWKCVREKSTAQVKYGLFRNQF